MKWDFFTLGRLPVILPGSDVIKGRLKPLPQQSVHGGGRDKTGLKRILIQALNPGPVYPSGDLIPVD